MTLQISKSMKLYKIPAITIKNNKSYRYGFCKPLFKKCMVVEIWRTITGIHKLKSLVDTVYA